MSAPPAAPTPAPATAPRFIQVILDPGPEGFDTLFPARLQSIHRQSAAVAPGAVVPDAATDDALLANARESQPWIDANPPPIASQADWDRLAPELAATIRVRARVLEGRIAQQLPLADYEQQTSLTATILMRPWAGFPAGTVGIVQRTTHAEVLYLLPLLKFDPADGSYGLSSHLQPLTDVVVAEMKPRLYRTTTALFAEDGQLDTLGKALMAFAATAAFALPEPYGIIISAVLAFFSMLFGGDGGLSKVIQEIVDEFKDFVVTEDLKHQFDTVKDAVGWLDTQSEVIKDVADDKSLDAYLSTQFMPQLQTALLPDSPLRLALEDLWNISSPDKLHDWDIRSSALNVLCVGVGTFLTYHRFRIQCQARLEGAEGYSGPGFVYEYYDQFRIEIGNWSQRITARVPELSQERLAMVGPLIRFPANAFLKAPAAAPAPAAVPTGTEFDVPYNYNPPPDPGWWTFTDSEPGTAPIQNYYDSVSGSCGNYSYAANEPEAQEARDQYIAALTSQLAQQYAGPSSMMSTYTANLTGWDQHLTPRAPVDAPAVSPKPAEWKGTVPNGSWVKGAKVRYAIAFANPSGLGPLGPWGAWTEVDERSLPLVTEIPVDPLKLATARHLHRQIQAPGSTEPGPDTVVTILADNETASWQDTTP